MRLSRVNFVLLFSFPLFGWTCARPRFHAFHHAINLGSHISYVVDNSILAGVFFSFLSFLNITFIKRTRERQEKLQFKLSFYLLSLSLLSIFFLSLFSQHILHSLVFLAFFLILSIFPFTNLQILRE